MQLTPILLLTYFFGHVYAAPFSNVNQLSTRDDKTYTESEINSAVTLIDASSKPAIAQSIYDTKAVSYETQNLSISKIDERLSVYTPIEDSLFEQALKKSIAPTATSDIETQTVGQSRETTGYGGTRFIFRVEQEEVGPGPVVLRNEEANHLQDGFDQHWRNQRFGRDPYRGFVENSVAHMEGGRFMGDMSLTFTLARDTILGDVHDGDSGLIARTAEELRNQVGNPRGFTVRVYTGGITQVGFIGMFRWRWAPLR